MKKCIALSVSIVLAGMVCSGAWGDVPIDEEHFPDSVFREKINEKDTDEDGVLSDEEIAKVNYLSVSREGISSLKGIEYFTALTSLWCEYNQLTELDVSSNKALDFLNCDDNELTELDVSSNISLKTLLCGDNQLTALDLSNNPYLEYFSCSHNQLTELDVSGNKTLQHLTCSDNQLTALDVSMCTALEWLGCYSNANMSRLTLGRNEALTYLACGSCNLSELDVSGCTSLTELSCYSNSMKNLNLRGAVSLRELDCARNEIETLDLSTNAALFVLDCADNELETLNLSGCPALLNLDCSGRFKLLSSSSDTHKRLKSLDLSSNTALIYLNCSYHDLSELDLSRNTMLTNVNCYNNNIAALDVSKNTSLVILTCTGNGMTTLNINGAAALAHLTCGYGNKLTALDLTNTPKLAILECNKNENILTLNTLSCPKLAILINDSSNDIINPDITNRRIAINEENFPDPVFREYISSLEKTKYSLLEDYKVEDGYLSPKEILDATYISSGTFEDKGISSLKGIEYLVALSGLNCSNNEIEELNLSNLQLLTALFCHKNQITELDLSNNRLLEYISCSDNNISSFSMNYCPALKSFYCNNNHITTGFDPSNCPLLETVRCDNNHITKLNITNTTLLEKVYCDSNDITELDFSDHQYLEDIVCRNNPLRVLKADNCPRIEKIYCPDCELVSLSFKNCPALTELLCTNNYLTELDLSGSPNLKELYCSKNNITALDLSHNPNLTSLYCYSNDLEELDLSANKELNFIMANNNRISKLNVSACTKLSRLDCEHNCLEELDVSANTSLLILYCWDNQITHLDVSKCRSLQRLACYRNSLTDINVSDNPVLTLLNCWGNNLSVIDVSNCPELYEFYCSTNQIAELDTSANPKLYELLCGRNQLRTLDLSGNPELYRLSCYDNQLRTLNITSNDKLKILTCSNNQLIDLDLSGNPALYTLECSANYLNTLDLSHNPELGRIFCNYTTIRSIDITNCPALWDIECKKGSLTMLDLSSNDAWAVMDGNSFEGLELINTSSEQYPYKTDMRPYVSENFSRVSNVHAFDRTGAEINALFSQYEGAVHFASMPVRMTYDYNTGNNTWSDEDKIMTVTVSIPTRSFIYLPKVEPVVKGRDEYVEVPDTSIHITEETVTDETGEEKTKPKATVTVTYSLHYVSHASLYDIVNESDDASFDIVYIPYERETQDTPTIPETPDVPESLDIPASADIPAKYFTGSSSGGCNSGLGLLVAAVGVLFMRRKRGILLLCLLLVCSTAYAENIHTSDYTLPIQLENYSPAGTYSTNFTLTPELRDTIAKIRGISSDRVHSYSEIASAGAWTVQPSDLYNLSRNGEYGGVVLPVTSGAASRDYYVIMCVFSSDVRPGEMLSLQGFEVSADTMETVYSREHSYSAARWVTLDDQFSRIEYVPENRRVYLAVSFAPEYINTGILTVIRGEYITENNPLERLDDDIAKRIAADLGISPDKLQYVSRAYLGDPREPTQAMKDYVKSSDMEIILNMPTVSIDEGYEGMYFSYELPDDIWEQVKGKSLSEYPIFALNDSDLSGTGQVKSSSIAWGVINLFELNGGKMDSFGVKEFLIAGVLQASKPFSLYLAKMIIMLLLGGCSSGINPSIVPVIILCLIVLKIPRKH